MSHVSWFCVGGRRRADVSAGTDEDAASAGQSQSNAAADAVAPHGKTLDSLISGSALSCSSPGVSVFFCGVFAVLLEVLEPVMSKQRTESPVNEAWVDGSVHADTSHL